jgi:hypothetical protein
MNRYHACTILAASLFAIATCPALGQDIRTPITVTEIRSAIPQMDDALAETERGHLEEWRLRAMAATEGQALARSPEDDIALLTSGIHLRLGNRQLANEMITTLPDARLEAMLVTVQGRRPRQPLDEAFARKRVAESVLARPSMSASHAEARLEYARMMLLTSPDIREIKNAFRECARATEGTSPELAGRATAAVAVLGRPEELADYRELISLRELTIDYSSREQRSWVCSPLVDHLLAEGIDDVLPARHGGDVTPLRAAARAAFDMAKPSVLSTNCSPQFATIPPCLWRR